MALFPQMLGEAYRQLEDLQALMMPLLVVTSEFDTVSMWDWEINRYLRLTGTHVIAPHNLDQTRKVYRSLGLKKELAQSSLHRILCHKRSRLTKPAIGSINLTPPEIIVREVLI